MRWPSCFPPLEEYEGEEYQMVTKHSDAVFDVAWNGRHWVCEREGYGKSNNYGSGSIFVLDNNGVNLLPKTLHEE